MTNPRNNGNLVGRLAADPRVFANSDGSHKVVFTVMTDRDYTNQAGERPSDGIPVEAFVRAGTNIEATPFKRIHKGDLVALATSLRMDRYPKNGETVYDLKVVVEDITFLESRTVTQERLNDRVKAAEAANAELVAQSAPAVQAPQAAPVAATVGAAGEQLPFG